ncbi:uncharacterized protein LOC108629576 [Ceratina calcarata]|uniref:Uncharacterized protein LOC108629576 n=1 Tax=Ceratina calcarata TaxID=156304 RepID=A0AAJ7S8C6_9HYME|nr:uncharacterized protein LOC108629576 [Ceratina calcarata]XP_026673225.1 uncharacterized protein LOC108629576 [Ceratina calcarata]XP_026673226.1 uncharacterized protein LOC108629576 [Ceratina calcarata]
MFQRLIVVFIACQILVQAYGIDVSRDKNVQLQLNNNDALPKTKLLANSPEERGPGFIGDLVFGQRYADETVFRRVIEFNNPSNVVQATTLDVSVTSGAIHYLSARNVQGSHAVVCGNSNVLGSSRTSISLRVLPNSLATLNLIVAAHDGRTGN